MFRKVFAKPVTLKLGEVSMDFSSSSEFEFALSGRTGLPSQRIMSLVEASDESLLREAEGIRQVEQHFSKALSDSMEESTAVAQFFKDLDLSSISQDNQWRTIMNALFGLDSSSDAYRRIALAKYSQYLTTRQEVVRTMYARRERDKMAASDAMVESRGGSNLDAKMRETVLFDLTTIMPASKKQDDFSRLPKGETIDVPFQPNQTLNILLAKHRFKIVLNDEFHFRDDNGMDTVMSLGKTIVGRDLSADVVVDAECRDVSRKHLIIEAESRAMLRLTDISSLGTSIPPEFMESTAL